MGDLTVPSLSHGEFLVTAFDYQEQLSNLYQVDLSLASTRYDIAPDEVIGQGPIFNHLACLAVP